LENRFSRLSTNLDEFTLVAPMDGMVQAVNHHSGAFVPDGEPILTLHSARSDRIVGYLRQPYVVEPAVGMKVEIVTRSVKRERFLATISEVGAQLEVITNALAMAKPTGVIDTGLPIIIRIPPGIQLRPGETVDILFMPRARWRSWLGLSFI
jgi:multidrug resistance efflux pump